MVPSFETMDLNPIDSHRAGRVSREALNVLLIATLPPSQAQTIRDHIEAFRCYSRHHVFAYNHYNWLQMGHKGFPVKLDLQRFDAIVIHYSTYLLSEDIDYFAAEAKEQLAAFKGLKVLFRQDEYMHVDGLIEVLQELKIDVLFTTFDEKDAYRIYDRPGLERLRMVRTLTGYVPEALLTIPSPPIADRKIDVGYRSRAVPFWLGSLGMEKVEISARFSSVAAQYGLTSDISCLEQDRIYGHRWIRFITSCRTVLGTESGASVIDFSGEIRQRTESYLQRHPQATFAEAREHCFAEDEWRYDQAQISPRCFEAAALKTAMVLYQGKYSGFLEPWRHYVPLKKDFSNIEEVAQAIKDVEFLQQLVDRAYLEVARNPRASYQHFVEGFDRVIGEEVHARGTREAISAYRPASFHFVVGQNQELSPGWSMMLMWLSSAGRRQELINATIPLSRLTPITITEPSSLGNVEHAKSQTASEEGPVTYMSAETDVSWSLSRFSIQLPLKSMLYLLRIGWGGPDEFPREFRLLLYRAGAMVRDVQITANQSTTTDVRVDGVVCDRVEVIVSVFNGSSKLCIDKIHVEALGYPEPSLVRRLWRKLPVEVRFAVNYVCRTPVVKIRSYASKLLSS